MFRHWPPEHGEKLQKAIESDLWVAPVACGLEVTSNFTSLIVLCPATNGVAISRDLPGKYDAEIVGSWMDEAAERFASPLCCAVDQLTVPLALTNHPPTLDCFWVRYRGLRCELPWKARRHGSAPEDKLYDAHPSQIKALALARQLQADFHDFETVHTDLHYLRESVKRLTCILHRNFVPDLGYIVAHSHDKVRF